MPAYNTTVNTFNDNLPAEAGTCVLIGTAVAFLAAAALLVPTRARLAYRPTPTQPPGGLRGRASAPRSTTHSDRRVRDSGEPRGWMTGRCDA